MSNSFPCSRSCSFADSREEKGFKYALPPVASPKVRFTWGDGTPITWGDGSPVNSDGT